MNILISTLSLIAEKRFREAQFGSNPQYKSDVGLITGYNTNDAPLKYLIRKMYQEVHWIDKVILFETKQCANDKMKDPELLCYDKTTTAYTKDLVLEELRSDDLFGPEYTPDDDIFISINVDDLNGDRIGQIINGIEETTEEDARIYFDFTGGYRVANLVALMMIRFLEAANYSVEHVIYSDLYRHEIMDITDKYRLFDSIKDREILAHEGFTGVKEDHMSALKEKGLGTKMISKTTLEKAKACDTEGKYAFFSYSHKDDLKAQAIIKHLNRRNYKIWYDEGIEPSTIWDEKIVGSLKNADCIIVLLSRHFYESDYCRKEMDIAREHGINPLVIFMETFSEQELDELKLTKDLTAKNIQGIPMYKYPAREDFYNKIGEASVLNNVRIGGLNNAPP